MGPKYCMEALMLALIAAVTYDNHQWKIDKAIVLVEKAEEQLGHKPEEHRHFV